MKYCYKRPTFDFYDTVAMECWLSDMAKKGLLYEGNNLASFRFSKAKPQDICYRVEPTVNDDVMPSDEMLSDYADAGWAFTAHQGKQFFIWKSTRLDVTEPLPYLPLDLIEQSEEFAWAEPVFMFDSDFDYNNYVDYSWTPLVPEHYEIRQEGAEQSHKWLDGSSYYSPIASTEYYRLAFSIFAPALFDELMELHLWEHEEYTIYEPEAFDRTVLAVNEEYGMSDLFVQRGNQVIYIRYQGYVDLSERLELLANVLSPL